MTSISDQEQDVTRADGMRQTEQDILGQVGSTIDERYEIISLLGKGGMSVVYKAKDLFLDRIVAVKMLLKGSVASHEALQRFQYEAKAISQLQHPNIIQVYAFNASELGVYLVMDYLEGISLDEILREDKRVPVDRALPIFRQTAAALEHAHSQGIVHRDLKPSNIMLVHEFESAEDDVVKLVDFGIAKLMPHEGEQVQQLTRAGAVFGTPAYMSPEQCTGRPLDARSDIYSFGSVMFEIIVGDPPLEGETPLATMYLQLQEKPPLLSEAMPGQEVSLDLERIIAKCLEKDPDNRFQTMNELVGALSSINRNSTTVVRISEKKPARKRRHYTKMHIGILVAVLLAAAGAGWLYINFDNLQIDYYNKVVADKQNSTLEQAIEAHQKLVTVLDKQQRRTEVLPHLLSLAEITELPERNATELEKFNAWYDAADYVRAYGLDDNGQSANNVIKYGTLLVRSQPANDLVDTRLQKVIEARISVASSASVEEPVTKLGEIYKSRGQYLKAQRLLNLIDIPEKEHLALSYLLTRAAVDLRQGNYPNAAECFDQAIKRTKTESARSSICKNAAELFLEAANYDQAVRYSTLALDFALKSPKGRALNETAILTARAKALLALHRPVDARKACESAMSFWSETKHSQEEERLYLLNLLKALGDAQFETGQFEAATKTFARRYQRLRFMPARSATEAQDLELQQLYSLRPMARSLLRLGQYADAAQVYQRVLINERSPGVRDAEAQHDRQHFVEANAAAKRAGQKESTWRDIERKYMPNLP
ncbi:MAG: serine/threonine-protein kinase [Candidatus Obscuribacterales bacterium]